MIAIELVLAAVAIAAPAIAIAFYYDIKYQLKGKPIWQLFFVTVILNILVEVLCSEGKSGSRRRRR